MKKLLLISISLIIIVMLSACSKNEIEISINPFPEIVGTDMNGNDVTNDIFSDYDATIVNFWNNYCGSCIEEMTELEEYYHEFKEQNINLIGVGTDSCESEENLAFSKEILESKGVTYMNIVPDMESEFYNAFISEISTYPITYIVNSEGDIVGAPIVGVVKMQDDVLRERLEEASK